MEISFYTIPKAQAQAQQPHYEFLILLAFIVYSYIHCRERKASAAAAAAADAVRRSEKVGQTLREIALMAKINTLETINLSVCQAWIGKIQFNSRHGEISVNIKIINTQYFTNAENYNWLYYPNESAELLRDDILKSSSGNTHNWNGSIKCIITRADSGKHHTIEDILAQFPIQWVRVIMQR